MIYLLRHSKSRRSYLRASGGCRRRVGRKRRSGRCCCCGRPKGRWRRPRGPSRTWARPARSPGSRRRSSAGSRAGGGCGGQRYIIAISNRKTAIIITITITHSNSDCNIFIFSSINSNSDCNKT